MYAQRTVDTRLLKEVQDPRAAIFVKGTHTGDVLHGFMQELMTLKQPIDDSTQFPTLQEYSQAFGRYLVARVLGT